MKLKSLLLVGVLATTSIFANDYVPYKEMAAKLVEQNKKNANYATVEEVKKAILSKDWIVADVRKKEEWSAARIKGTVRIGRQSPEKALANFVLDDKDKFVKQNLIVICNSAKRASVEAETFRLMGFKQVKVFDLYTWIDTCNPLVNDYSSKSNKSGTKNKFGSFKAQHCYK